MEKQRTESAIQKSVPTPERRSTAKKDTIYYESFVEMPGGDNEDEFHSAEDDDSSIDEIY